MRSSKTSRPATAAKRGGIECTREGTFLPKGNSTESVEVAKFLNTLTTELHLGASAGGVRNVSRVLRPIGDWGSGKGPLADGGMMARSRLPDEGDLSHTMVDASSIYAATEADSGALPKGHSDNRVSGGMGDNRRLPLRPHSALATSPMSGQNGGRQSMTSSTEVPQTRGVAIPKGGVPSVPRAQSATLFRANRRQTHTGSQSVFALEDTDTRIAVGTRELAEESAMQRTFVPTAAPAVDGPAPMPASVPDPLLDPTGHSTYTSRSAVARRTKTRDWLVYWGDVQRLGGDLSMMIERLSLSESSAGRLQSEVGWLTERLARANEDFNQLQLAMTSEEERRKNMVFIEKSKYEGLQSDLSTMRAQVGDMRRKVTSAEAALASSRADVIEYAAKEAEMRKTMLSMSDEHTKELAAQKEKLTAELALDEQKRKKLDYLETDHAALLNRVKEQQKLVDQLLKQRGDRTPAAPSVAAKSEDGDEGGGGGGDRDATMAKLATLGKSPSPNRKRSQSTTTTGGLGDKLPSAVFALGSSQSIYPPAGGVRGARGQWQAEAAERQLMAIYDRNANSMRRHSSVGVTLAGRDGDEMLVIGGEASTSSSPRPTKAADTSKLSLAIPTSMPSDGVAWRQLQGPSYKEAHKKGREVIYQHIPVGVAAMSEVVGLLWAEATGKMRPGRERDVLHRKVTGILAGATGAWRDALKAHMQGIDALVAAEAELKTAETRAAQGDLARGEDSKESKFKMGALLSENDALTVAKKTLAAEVKGHAALLRVALASINDTVAGTQLRVKAIAPNPRPAPTAPGDAFPTFSLAEGSSAVPATTALDAARCAIAVANFCDGVKHEHEERSRHTMANATAGEQQLSAEVERLKERCMQAEKAAADARAETSRVQTQSDAYKQQAAKLPTLKGVDPDAFSPTCARSRKNSFSKSGGSTAASPAPSYASPKGARRFSDASRSTDSIHTASPYEATRAVGVQCTIIPERRKPSPIAERLYKASCGGARRGRGVSPPADLPASEGSYSTDPQASLLGASAPAAEQGAVPAEATSPPVAPQSALLDAIIAQGNARMGVAVGTSPSRSPHALSLQGGGSPLNARAPIAFAATGASASSSRYVVNNATGQEDALYYQLQWLQRNGGAFQGGGGSPMGRRPMASPMQQRRSPSPTMASLQYNAGLSNALAQFGSRSPTGNGFLTVTGRR